MNPTVQAGVHSAILNLDSPTSTGIEYQTMNTVVAAEDFTAANGYQVKPRRQGRPQRHGELLRPRPGERAGAEDRPGRRRYHAGCRARSGSSATTRTACRSRTRRRRTATTRRCRRATRCDAGDPTSRTFANPLAGVWEIVVEARRTSDAANAPYTMTASVLGATVSPNPDTIASATARPAGLAAVHADERVRSVHREGPGHDAGQRPARDADHRRRGTVAVPDRGDGRARPRCGSRSATRPISAPTSTCSCSTARAVRACRRRRPRTVTPRKR